jgi:hypothetical protein
LLVLHALALALALAASPAARAQSGSPGLQLIRIIEADEVGAPGLPGLPFPPPGATVRLEMDEPAVGVASIFLPYARSRSARFPGLRIEIPDPINLAFAAGADGSFGLLLLDGTRDELTQVEVLSASRTNRARVHRFSASAWGVADPRGMTVDPVTGRIFILDPAGHRIVWLESELLVRLSRRAGRSLRARPDHRISEIDLPRGLSGLRGIAINPTDGHLHVLSPGAQELYELDAAGRLMELRELSALGPLDPQAMTFAPSTDGTDDPSQTHLFLAAAGSSGETIVTEWSLSAPVSSTASAQPTATASFSAVARRETAALMALPSGQNMASLIQDFDVSAFDPPSPDPAGIAYNGTSDSLLMSDSEVNEMPLYEGTNVFEMTRFGSLFGRLDTTHFSGEPSGVAINPANGHCFFSDDTGTRSIYAVDPGPDGLCLSGDDDVTSFPTTDFGGIDPEGLAFGQGTLFIIDGTNREIYKVAPGANGVFDGAPPSGDDLVTSCDTANLGVNDPEGITFDPVTGHLYVVGRPETQLAQITTTCDLVRLIDISAANAVTPAGAALAPSSVDPGEMSIWITDRGVDNDPQPDENDGRLYELSLPFLTPGNTPPVVSAGSDQILTFPDDALLAGNVTDDGLPSPSSLTSTWSTVSGQGMVSFDDASQAVTNASFSAPGFYVLRLTASDGELQSTDDVTITVVPFDGSTIFEKRVEASVDDAEELELGGSVDRFSSDLEMVFNNNLNQVVGIRFTDISVPPEATILDAYIQFQVDETGSGPASLTLDGEAVDHAAPFLEAAGDISSRPPTAASVSWDPLPWTTAGEAGLDQRTPNLSAIIQEIVDRPGWSSGNALAIVVSGTGKRVAESVDGNFNGAPLLHVRYAEGTPPVVTITAPLDGSGVTEGDPVSFAGTAIDPEDGDLSAGLSWVSDLDGALGSGASFTTPSLSAGLHTITAWVSDSGGLPGSHQIALDVAAANTPPVVVITSPLDGSAVLLGDPVSFAGTASDPEDGDLSAGLGWVSDLDGAIGSGAGFTTSSLSAGLHTITASVSDSGALPGSDQIAVDVIAVPSDVIVEKRIDTSFDDAEERAAGNVSRLNADLEMVFDGGNQTVGVRFDGLSIPPGVAILEAYIQFQVDETGSTPTFLTLEGEAADHAAVFIQATNNLSSRPRTAASVPWSPVPWLTVGEAGPDQRTPDLSAIIQAIVDRPGWSNGNALAVLITGTGERVAEAFDGDSNAAPLLHVRYRVGGNKVPVVIITAPPDGSSVAQGDPVSFAGTASDAEDGDLSASLSWVSDLDGALGSGAGFTTSSLSVGLHTITASVTDSGGRGGSDPITLTVLAVLPDGSTIFEKRVEASSDDAEENEAGAVSIRNADLELVVDGTPQTVGIRFTGVSVPPGATILDAYIQFQADETHSSTASLTLEAEAAEPRTTAFVPWSPVPWLTVGEAGPDQQTSDLSPVIQEIVDRPGWSSGNALAILITGTEKRVAEAFDGDVNGAPLLHVRYLSGGP